MRLGVVHSRLIFSSHFHSCLRSPLHIMAVRTPGKGTPSSKKLKVEDPDFEVDSEAGSGSESSPLSSLRPSSEDVDGSDSVSEDDVMLVDSRSGTNPGGFGTKKLPGISERRVHLHLKSKLDKAPEEFVVPDVEECIFSKEDLAQLRTSLLSWYDENHRVLPWRRNPHSKLSSTIVDEYRIKQGIVPAPLDLDQDTFIYYVWVCEIMSQQTQVSRVCEYFTKWVKKWPTVHELANATQDEVNDMWAGLGYYRRARFLLDGAKYVVNDLNGKFPKDSKDLQKIPGIGAYTSCAIASIACGEKSAVVDGNVIRVLSRLRKIAGDPKVTSMSKLFSDVAQRTLDEERPGDFNQAMMELGATVCIPNGRPLCKSCPVSMWCKALEAENKSPSLVSVTNYPTKSEKAKKREERVGIAVLRVISHHEKVGKDSGKFLLIKRPLGGLLAGLWEFPLQHIDASASKSKIQSVLDSYLASKNISPTDSLVPKHRKHLGEALHVFSHIRMTMVIEEICLQGSIPDDATGDEIQWLTYNDLVQKGLSSGVKKVLGKYNDHYKKEANSIANFFKAKDA
jgi:A/G-specific adenine glycosylase